MKKTRDRGASRGKAAGCLGFPTVADERAGPWLEMPTVAEERAAAREERRKDPGGDPNSSGKGGDHRAMKIVARDPRRGPQPPGRATRNLTTGPVSR